MCSHLPGPITAARGIPSPRRWELLDQAERVNRRAIDHAVDFQAVVLLKGADCAARCRTKRPANCPTKITQILKCPLDINDHLVGKQVAVSENGAVVIVAFVARIITPSWEPISRVKIITAAPDNHDGAEMTFPPIATVPRVLVAGESL